VRLTGHAQQTPLLVLQVRLDLILEEATLQQSEKRKHAPLTAMGASLNAHACIWRTPQPAAPHSCKS
jgi:hypothetical protein